MPTSSSIDLRDHHITILITQEPMRVYLDRTGSRTAFKSFTSIASCHLCKYANISWSSRKLCHLCHLRLVQYRNILHGQFLSDLKAGKSLSELALRIKGFADAPFPPLDQSSDLTCKELLQDAFADIRRAEREVNKLIKLWGINKPLVEPFQDDLDISLQARVRMARHKALELEKMLYQLHPLKRKSDIREFRRGMKVFRVKQDQGEWGMRMI